MFVVNNRCNFS